MDESLGKELMLLSTERMLDFLNLMERFQQLTFEQVVDIITTGVWDREDQRNLLDLVEQARADGLTIPFQIENLSKELRAAVSHSFHIADRVGGVSGVGSMVFQRNRGLAPWRLYNPNCLVENFTDGVFGRVSGKPRKGKTNLACVLIENRGDLIILSNIRPTEPTSAWTFVQSSKGLFHAIGSLPEGSRWLFILDEPAVSGYSRADASTRRAKDLDKLARVIGKLHGNLLLLEQRPAAVPTTIQEFATIFIFCHDKKGVVSFDFKGPELRASFTVQGFPKTTLPFDTRDIAFFNTKDVDLPTLLEAVSGQDPKGAMLAFVEKTRKKVHRDLKDTQRFLGKQSPEVLS